MPRLAAFLRAVNVGGTGKLAMADLKGICQGLGFSGVKTYIASGNVVFDTGFSAATAREKLCQALQKHLGKAVDVFVRDAEQLRALLAENPFPEADGSRHMIILLHADPSPELISGARFQTDEVIKPGTQVLHVHYPSGMGRSKLKIPGAEKGTARNRNTIGKMLELLGG